MIILLLLRCHHTPYPDEQQADHVEFLVELHHFASGYYIFLLHLHKETGPLPDEPKRQQIRFYFTSLYTFYRKKRQRISASVQSKYKVHQ